jgi:hypothetical protein
VDGAVPGLRVRYDPALAYPVEIAIDPERDLTDDTIVYEASALEPRD